MKIDHSQQTVRIILPNRIKNVGLKISGGADSAIVGYMLSKYVVEERPDITIIPITVKQIGRAFQEQFSKQVLDFLKNEFGNIFGNHYIRTSTHRTVYAKTQEDLVEELYQNNIIDCHFVGITQNPPINISPKKGIRKNDPGPGEHRSAFTTRKTVLDARVYRPLININKKGVKELYDTFNLMDRLFPLTRSCEADTDDFSKHCQQCWFCAERYYGFGRYE